MSSKYTYGQRESEQIKELRNRSVEEWTRLYENDRLTYRQQMRQMEEAERRGDQEKEAKRQAALQKDGRDIKYWDDGWVPLNRPHALGECRGWGDHRS
jgi:hypothetical protein